MSSHRACQCTDRKSDYKLCNLNFFERLHLISMKNLFFAICLFLGSEALYAAQTTLTYEINGVTGEVLTNVQARLNGLKTPYGKTLPESAIQEIYQQAPKAVKQALEPYGYFRSEVQASLSKTNQGWQAHFVVALGEPLRIHSIAVQISGEGSGNGQLQKIKEQFPLKSGMIFATPIYQDAKEKLFVVAHNQGYVKAFLEKNSVFIDLKKYRADIVLVLQTGPRYFFGPVTFENNQYAPSFLQRFVTFKPQESFSSQKIALFQQDLSSSYYFQQAVVTPEFDQANNFLVPIKVSALAPKAKRYTFGIGYGTFTGPRITTGVSFRRLTDTGQHFDAQLKFSSVLSSIVGKYYIPGKNPLTDQWITGISYQRFLPKNGSSSSSTLFGGYSKKFQYWQGSVNLNYLFEEFKVTGMPAETSSLLYPSLNLAYSKSNDLLHPTSGAALNFQLQGANAFSTTRFLQSEIKAKYLYSPFDFAHLLLRADVGYTTVEDIRSLPLSMRFFAGGSNSIRGYRDSSIGPGRYLEVFSAEYQNHIAGNWSGAVFYDFGTASNHFGQHLSAGRGVGVVYQSLLGPVKFYVAQAMSRPGKPLGVEFSIGPEF